METSLLMQQVQLDFDAVDANGNLIWDPRDPLFGMSVDGFAALPTNGAS